jgi:hypothetical protein
LSIRVDFDMEMDAVADEVLAEEAEEKRKGRRMKVETPPLSKAISLALVDFAIASAMTPAIMPVPMMPKRSGDDFIGFCIGKGYRPAGAQTISRR